MSRPSARIALTLATTLVPMLALAGSVFLNGVNIDGVKNQRFEKATVRIDAEGNVHIDAPGYAARVTTVTPAPPPTATPPVATPPVAAATDAGVAPAAAPSGTPAPVPGRITQRYWLVTEQTTPGMTDFDIDVYVNSRWVRRLRNNEDQVVQEITSQLRPGPNAVTLIARKVAGGSRRSISANNVFKVIIGEGNEGGGNVMIDTPLIRFQKTAADAQDATEEFTLTTR
ncbi:hypothetical protein D7V97_21445 [Corallococcus sp. CA053C]|uniref:hypothetical protein n=1 Tax=Corallococcus sp. CA053C TaxID=2316732 RepID=UPI000EA20D9D|nr:hypothetical protein [Corallococcus sp. CA053C]RKH07332.1 hypothetical protein D7V97_21445 [Corallococcus sp. CA053C]